MDTVSKLTKPLHLAFYSSALIVLACDIAIIAFGAVSLSVVSDLQPARYLIVLGEFHAGVFGGLVIAFSIGLMTLKLIRWTDKHPKVTKFATIAMILASVIMISAHSFVAFLHYQTHSDSVADLKSADDCSDSEVLASLQLAYDLAQAVKDSGCTEDCVLDCQCYSDELCLADFNLEVELLSYLEDNSDCGGFCDQGLRLFSDGDMGDSSCREELESAIFPIFIRCFALVVVATLGLGVSASSSVAFIILSKQYKELKELLPNPDLIPEAPFDEDNIQQEQEERDNPFSLGLFQRSAPDVPQRLRAAAGDMSSIKGSLNLRTSEGIFSREPSILHDLNREH
mmetsp:Transcript_2827/g.6124  ORF Transcript_2827/g.6124 Transcript_2827/m.6124 type:complete len:341 (+) Transcript_2827:27-1049(+)